MNDQQIRAALKMSVLHRYTKEPDAIILDELGIGHGIARIDIAVVNGHLLGFEIKSNRDKLSRLPIQVPRYNAVFDRITLVIGAKHLNQSLLIVPHWWGIQVADVDEQGNTYFSLHRASRKNPGIDPIALAKLLWRAEALACLEELGAAKGLHSKPRLFLYTRLAQVADINALRSRVRHHLKTRTGWRSDDV
jgi:hypothetical protein